jgi:hypothetical protein
LNLRLAGPAFFCSLAVATLGAIHSGESRAGIVHDMLVSVGLAKPPPAPPGTQSLPRQGYACCNLHYKGDWISDGNYAELPLIPAGTPIEVISYGRNRAYVKVDGKPMTLGHDYGRDQESLQAWVDKIVTADDPRPRIARYPVAIREAIHEGKVVVGMTREEAITSIGFPMTNENFSIDVPVWKIWRSAREEYDLHFREDGRVGSITADDSVVTKVVYRPGQ